MKKFLILILLASHIAFAEDARSILSKSLEKCRSMKAGSYVMKVSSKSFRDKAATELTAKCSFSPRKDSLFGWKYLLELSNGDRKLVAEGMLVDMKGADSSASIYMVRDNANVFSSAGYAAGLFPPIFNSSDAFSSKRWNENTFILRQKEDKTLDGKNCYQLQLIDASRPSQRNEKIFLIDKQSMLPMEYSEIGLTLVDKDSLMKQSTYTLTHFDEQAPADSIYSFASVPLWFELKNVLPAHYHHHLKPGDTAPAFRATSVQGDRVSVGARDKTLLFFMTLSSYPSLKAIMAMHELQKEFNGVNVILVGVERPRSLREIVTRRKISLTSVADTSGIAEMYFVNATPTFILINSHGVVKNVEVGFNDRTVAKLRDELAKLD